MVNINSNRFKRLAKSGKSTEEIADLLDCPVSTLAGRSNKLFGVSLSKLRYEGILDEMIKVEAGEKHTYQVREQYGHTPVGFYHVLFSELGCLDIVFKEKPLEKKEVEQLRITLGKYNHSELNSLIDNGATLEEIARVYAEITGFKAHNSSAERYIVGSGQHSYWKSLRMDLSNSAVNRKRKDLLSTVVQDLFNRTEIKKGDSDYVMAEKMAARFVCLSRPSTIRNVDLETVKALFLDYYSTLKSGNKISHSNFADRNGGFFNCQNVRYIFWRLGLPPMYAKSVKSSEIVSNT